MKREGADMTSAFQIHILHDLVRRVPTAPLKVGRIGPRDCFVALAEGFDDFLEMPTYPAFAGLFYALAGVTLVSLSSFANALHLAFPLAAGFALIGPFVAAGLCEMSRRRELGQPVTWRDAFAVWRSPALPSVLALGVVLFAIFAAWIGAAQLLYLHMYGPNPPAAAPLFFRDVLTSGRGWLLIILGGVIGFCFAALALCVSVVSFPLMLDREVGFAPAVGASLRVSHENPIAVALWGLIVATALVIGALPLFFGLAVAMPVLGHATWRFYRRAIRHDAIAGMCELPIDQSRKARGEEPAMHRRAQRPVLSVVGVGTGILRQGK
jgi:uncharacterized membrane protein